jgi:RecA/RadA recombinase
LQALQPGETLFYVVDSLDGLSSLAETGRAKKDRAATKKGEAQEGTYGMEKQKFLSKFFRLRALELEERRVILLIISQVRYNVSAGLFEPKYQRSGGKGMDFYAGAVYWLHPREKQVKRERVTGVTVLAKNSKNKIGKPFRNVFFDIVFDYGIDNVRSNLISLNDLRTDAGKLKSKREQLTFDGQTGGLEALIDYVEKQNKEKELAQAVVDKWMEIEDSISPKDRKRRF